MFSLAMNKKNSEFVLFAQLTAVFFFDKVDRIAKNVVTICFTEQL